jgi:hypothetical protein
MIGTFNRLKKARTRVAIPLAALCTVASVGLFASPASATLKPVPPPTRTTPR